MLTFGHAIVQDGDDVDVLGTFEKRGHRRAVAALLEAESALDAAAAALTDAVAALPAGSGRKPVGWGEPPAVSGEILIARHLVARIALRCLSADYAGESADADATAEYADEQLCLAARNLAADAAARAEAAKVAPVPSLPLEWPAGAEGKQ